MNGSKDSASHAAPSLIVAAALLLGLLTRGSGTVHGASAGAGVSKIVIGQPIGSGSMVLDEQTGHLFVDTSPTGPGGSLVTMIDMRDGRLVRQTPIGIGWARLALDPSLDRVYTSGTAPLPRPPAPFVPVTTMIHGRSGRLLATRQLAGDTVGMLQEGLIGDDATLGRLFVASGGGRSCMNNRCTTQPNQVRVIDAHTLGTLAIIPVGSSPQDSPLVDERNGRVYISTQGGTDVLDARSGKRLLRIPLTTRLLAVNPRTDRVYLAAGTSTLLLDGPTSQVLAVLPLSPGRNSPSSKAIAVDPDTGRIYFAAGQRETGPVRCMRRMGLPDG